MMGGGSLEIAGRFGNQVPNTIARRGLWLSTALLFFLFPLACTSPDESTSGESSDITVVKKEVLTPIGPEGGGFRSADGVLSLILPPQAVDEPVTIRIVPIAGRTGARETPLYRVDLVRQDGSPATLARPATLIMDFAGTAFETAVAPGAPLHIARAPTSSSPQAALRVHGRVSNDPKLASSLQLVGVAFDVAGEVGLVEGADLGRAGGPLPACVEKCFEGDEAIRALAGGGCGVDVVGGKAQACLQSCDVASLSACVPARAIDCGGTSCASCCLQHGKLTCDPACTTGTLEGKVTVDCLIDSDCGAGLSCCVPETVRGGGTLIVKDARITCRASCKGEQLHLCNVDDPNRCSGCEAARKSCSRGFCGPDTTAAAVVCPL